MKHIIYFRKWCKKCGKKFRPTGYYQKLCVKCRKKSQLRRYGPHPQKHIKGKLKENKTVK